MPTTRRSFLARSAQLTAAVVAAPWISRAAEAKATLLETKVISQQPEFYHGWPTVARRRNGELWVSWSGGRESHVDPFGQVHAMTSRDEGATWSFPRVLLDSATDDRDSGVVETAKGALLVTTFTSLAYETHLQKASVFEDLKDTGWVSKRMPAEQVAKWQAAHARLTDAERKAELGEWLIRSTDGGRSWSTRIPTVVNSPHGPIQLNDGRLLYAGKQLWSKERKIGVAVSADDGLSWQWLAEIPARKDDKASGYHELHAVEAANGTIIAQIRNHNPANTGWTLQSDSTDGGRTWSEPRPICYGLPSHLLRLRDHRLLMSYGYRRAPYGNRARVSADHGRTWGEEFVISADGMNGDLGYPSTVELADGTLLTVWYETMAQPKLAVLRQAKWRLA
ncbi:sialidase family protein [Horticoccus sp. 23ND18S-11]|uniref:sialidase family protein n=1 Tax=Horticoccus sp. 23ND18S-11 TaxID=3391832 RepID=UPI0039C926A7